MADMSGRHSAQGATGEKRGVEWEALSAALRHAHVNAAVGGSLGGAKSQPLFRAATRDAATTTDAPGDERTSALTPSAPSLKTDTLLDAAVARILATVQVTPLP
jgi:hypothetical protein